MRFDKWTQIKRLNSINYIDYFIIIKKKLYRVLHFHEINIEAARYLTVGIEDFPLKALMKTYTKTDKGAFYFFIKYVQSSEYQTKKRVTYLRLSFTSLVACKNSIVPSISFQFCPASLHDLLTSLFAQYQ